MSETHSFDLQHAYEYGIDCAIMLKHFIHWIGVNKRKKINEHEGRTWTYQTLEDIAAHFPYWTQSQVFDIIEKLRLGKNRKSKSEKLEFSPVLMKGNFNQHAYDRTIWYALINEKDFTILGNSKMENGESQNGDREIPTPIPDTKTDTKPDTKTNLISPPSFPEESISSKSSLPLDKTRQGKFFEHPNAAQEKKEVMMILKSLKFEGEPINDATMMRYVKTHTPDDIRQAIERFKYEMGLPRDKEVSNMIGMFCNILDERRRMPTKEELDCIEHAKAMKSKYSLEALEFAQGFVFDSNTRKDVSFEEIDLKTFIDRFYDAFIRPIESPKWSGL